MQQIQQIRIEKVQKEMAEIGKEACKVVIKDVEEEVLVLLQVERLPSFLTFHMDVPSIRQGPHRTQQQVGWGTRLAIDRWCFLILPCFMVSCAKIRPNISCK